MQMSQSLWVRDRFLIKMLDNADALNEVAIPLGQGQVFNQTHHTLLNKSKSRNPFGSGTGF